MTSTAWRQELARTDSLGRADDLQEMVAALPWAQREELRAWLICHQGEKVEMDPTADAARREIGVLLPWIRPDALPYLVRMARALAERR